MTLTYYGNQQVSKQLFYEQLVDNPPPVIAIDTETISLKEKLPIGFSIATSPNEAWWFDSYPERDAEIEMLGALLSNPNIIKVFANVMFDIRIMPLIFTEFVYDESNIADVLVWARLLGHTNARVTDLASTIGREVQPAEELLIEYGTKTMIELPREAVSSHCATDAKATLALYHHFLPQMSGLGLSPDYLDVERKVVPILVDMSLRGLKIDQEARAAMEKKMEEDRDYYSNFCASYDFKPGSGMQAGYILAKRGNFLPFTKSGKQYKTDEETLELIDDPLAAVVLGYKRANSILTKYLYPLRNLDRIYTEYGLDTEVGRTKSSNFNMQNIPAKSSRIGIDVRHIFLPDNDVFTSGDFSQLHLRFLMHMSDDTEMKRVYYDGKDGGDIHVSTMKKIHKPRSISKIVNYAIPYGGDAHTLAKQMKTKNLRWCSDLIDDWFNAYPEAAQWLRDARKYAVNNGKSLPTLFNRQIAIPEEFNKWGKLDIKAMERKGANYPILGSDGEVMKRALIICSNRELPLAVQIHDSITLDGDCTFPIEALESLAPVATPFEVDKSERWK
uniref:Putative DNA polymerase n=2 Tax=viral metagenome TaxID=1070528 RepID=A0A6M3IJ69_9ZZZZ